MKSCFFLLAAVLFSSAFHSADAAVVTLDHVDRGAFNSADTRSLFSNEWKVVQSNYQIRAVDTTFTGLGPSIDSTRNYTIFDLSGVSGTATGATLKLWQPGNSYDSTAASETVEFFSVTTSHADLMKQWDKNTEDASHIFPDLGSGTSYGTGDFTLADNSSYVEITLNAAARADINTAISGGSTWALGGDLLTNDGDFASFGIQERVMRGTGAGSNASQLVLTGVSVVPEPSAFLLLLTIAGFSGDLKRQRQCSSRHILGD